MKKQTAIEWLIKQVESKQWQDMYAWHKHDIYAIAKRMDEEQRNEAIQEAVSNLKVYEVK